MMTWNYRVFRDNDSSYALREVFYAEDGTILGCAEDAVEVFGQSLNDLHGIIDDLKAALTMPVLTFEDIPQTKESTPSREQKPNVNQKDIRAVLGLEDVSPSQDQAEHTRRKTA